MSSRANTNIRSEGAASNSNESVMKRKSDEGLGLRKKPHFLGPMDKFASKINPEASMTMSTGTSLRQQHITDVLFKERTHSVQRYVAKWVYEAGIPFNAT
ncbi:hypothetical protein ACOSP7_031986 [Xanthoceras sorbifolium]